MEARDYVIQLLKKHNRMTEEIASLKYELEHFISVNNDAVIEGMNFSSPDYDNIHSGTVSDKTAHIALGYTEVAGREREEAQLAVTARLNALEKTLGRLDYYLSRLDEETAEVLRRYYFEKTTWRDLQEQMGLTVKTLRKLRDSGVAKLAERYASLISMSVIPEADLSSSL